jgi:hypothetical protein
VGHPVRPVARRLRQTLPPARCSPLGDLVKCAGATVHVGFKKLDDNCDWRVSHDAHGNRFQVEVNLKSKKIKIEDLYIPEAKGPALRKE